MCEIDVNGVKITLTKKQLVEIDRQTKRKLPIEERVTTIEQVFKELREKYIILPYKYPENKEEKSINALSLLFKIAKVYNEGYELDWKNTNEYKYLPYKYLSSGSWVVNSNFWYSDRYYPGGLYYKSSKLADAAYKNFKNIFEDWLT